MASRAEEITDVAPPPPGQPRYINRELSYLEFNSRVLAQAADPAVPLLERAKFVAIFSGNQDEFFQVRVAGLKDQLAAGVGATLPSGDTPAEQLSAIAAAARELVAWQSKLFSEEIRPALAEAGIAVVGWDDLDGDDRDLLAQMFGERIFPVLTPLAVDPGHPFPYISNLSLNLAAIVADPETGERRFARVKVPPLLPRFVALPDGERFVPLEQVIAAHLDALFPGMDIECHYPFRVTRNADLTLEEEEAEDLLAAVELELRRRRFGKAVRLEVEPDMSTEVRERLVRELELDEDDLYDVEGPLDLTGLWAMWELNRPELKDEPWPPVTQPRLAPVEEEPADIFAVLRDRDVLVHHPYESFTTSVEAFIKQAAADPAVLAIKQTLYRTSGDSPIVKALIRANERGKQVAALVELKARFDEQANIAWARALEEAGVHVVYGLVGLKTHSKTALVVRQEDEGIRRYCHIGTGNYNPTTARLYEDIGLLTADQSIGADLTDLFNFLTGYSRRVDFRKVVMAPFGLRERVLDLIAEQTAAGAAGRIVMKMNHLVDRAVIDALYAASAAGVEIDLIVRTMCSLRPGVSGLSEHIRVRSIVGRYLEHSRIFAFGPERREGDASSGDGARLPRRWLIGSADMMARNLDGRVEVMAPVEDTELQDRLQEVLDVVLADDEQSWELQPDGTWRRPRATPGAGVGTNRRLRELAVERSRRPTADVRARAVG